MADNVLRVGAEFDVSQIVAGSKEAVASFDGIGKAVGDASAKMLNELYPTELAVSEATAAATNSTAANTEALELNAAASQTAASGARSNAEANIQARLTTDLLTGNIARAENALVRFAARSGVIGPLMQAAFLPFAAVAFVEIIEHAYESFKKLADEVTGYTKVVQDAQAADVKFSEAALGHALTLEEAESKLTAVIREQGDVAAETYGDKFASAAQRASDATSAWLELIPGLRGLVITYEALAHAESDAADQAVKLEAAQRSLIVDGLQKTVDIDREAIKLIDDRVAAENAGLSGADDKVTGIRNEIAALQEKQRVEEEISVKEAGLKAIRGGGDAVAAEAAARAQIDEEYYYKRIELTGKLSAAQEDAARKDLDRDNAAIKMHQDLEIADQKLKDNAKDDAEAEAEYFKKSGEKEVLNQIGITQKKIEAQARYVEESNKIAEQNALQGISYQEQAVSEQARLEEQRMTIGVSSELSRAKIKDQINQEEIAKLRALEDQKLAIELDFLQKEKAILLGGVSEKDFVGIASPEQLTKLTQLNSQIEAAQAQHNAKMAQLDSQSTASANAAALARVNAYMKVFDPINRAMDGMVQGIIMGTQTVSQAFARMGANILISTIESLAKVLLHHVETEIAVTLAHVTGTQARVAATGAAAAETKAITTATSLHEIAHAAAVAAAKAYSAMADIPIIGPELGAIAAAATFAAVLAFDALAGAEQGAEIPSDMPIYVHAGETVAPKPLSTAMHTLVPNIQRFNESMSGSNSLAPALAGGGSLSQSSESTQNIHVNFSAIDQKSVSDFLHSRRADFTKAIRTAVRNGVRTA